MIGKLTGKVNIYDNHLIIDVNGVGYLVYTPSKNLNNMINHNQYELFIETYVREDQISLYGFLSLQEKQIFNLLNLVNGLGPKMAINILSTLNVEQVIRAVQAQDKDLFKSISGVGTKLAEKIIIELRNKVTKINNIEISNNTNKSYDCSIANDAISALTNLGINKLEARNMVNSIIIKKPEISLDDLIKNALQNKKF